MIAGKGSDVYAKNCMELGTKQLNAIHGMTKLFEVMYCVLGNVSAQEL